MNTITLTLCASTRTGCLSGPIPSCADERLTLAGDLTLSAGTSLALLTPRGTTLAHTILSEQAAPGASLPLSTLTAQAAEYTRSCRAGDTREALLAIGDSEHPLALIPARIAQNPLYTLAPPTAQAPAYPTSEALHALLSEVQAAALRAENAAAAVDAPALKAAIAQNAEAISAEATERAETDQAITQAVNNQASVIEQHQSNLSTLSKNYNNLAASYAQSVTDLQKKDAQLETAISSKAPATHTHAIADTTGLQSALDTKAAAADIFAEVLTQPPPTGTDRANFYGWVGTLADWGIAGEQLDLRTVTITRRNNAGGVTNATFYARIVHLGADGTLETLFQSTNAISWSAVAYDATATFSLAHIPGKPYPSATERIALYFVTDTASPSWKSVGTFGLKTQLNASGGIANEPTSQTALPGGQAFRPILGWSYLNIAASLEARLTERIAALESALTATIDGQTYRLQWSSTAGTFELVEK